MKPTEPGRGDDDTSRAEISGGGAAQERTPWSLRIGTVAGIPIRIHASFWLLLILVAWISQRSGQSFASQALLVGGLFACVVLHELGHALMAKLFGIGTQDITLYPIGGVSRLQSMGSAPQELLIAVAGPAVNVFIAVFLAWLLVVRGEPITQQALVDGNLTFLQGLLAGNIMLALFNIVPAFPMDGGRILRAALALVLDRTRATQIAARIGQALAIVMGLYGLLGGGPLLMVIALFIFMGAGAEAETQRAVATTSGYAMRDAMITRYETIQHGDTLGAVAERLLRTTQEDFPVAHGDRVLGILTRRQLLSALASEGKEALVAGVMSRDFPKVAPDDDLTKALELLRASATVPLLVFDQEKMVGMVTLDNLVEFLSVARAGGAPPPSSGQAHSS